MSDTIEPVRILDPKQIDLFAELPSVIGHNVGSGYDRVDDDWYVEPEFLVHRLIDRVKFAGPVHDPACGKGTIPKVFLSRGIKATGSDIRDRGYGETGVNFFDTTQRRPVFVSNPPFAVMQEFIDHALSLATCQVAVITRLAFLESQKRKPWFERLPLQYILVSSRRASMPPGAKNIRATGTMIPFCWLLFNQRWKQEPRVKWL